MSAVVHTGSSEARSACGTKVIVFPLCPLTMRGSARVVPIARADLRKVRRFMGAILRGVPAVLPPPRTAGNQDRDFARCTRPFCAGRSLGFRATAGRGGADERRLGREAAWCDFLVAIGVSP